MKLNVGDKFYFEFWPKVNYEIVATHFNEDAKQLYDLKVISSPDLTKIGYVYINQIIDSQIRILNKNNHPFTKIFL